MSLEQKIRQLQSNMETVDIYAVTSQATTAEEMDQLATQIRVGRHVIADEELGIPRMRVTNGPVGVGMGDGTPSPPATALPMTIGFQKVWLDPGESAEVSIPLDPTATAKPLSVWDYGTRGFRVVDGEHRVLVGTSSEDTPHELTLTVTT